MAAIPTQITIAVYLLILFVVARRSSGNASNATFFKGGRQQSPLVVGIAMMGAPISGISLISLPGSVATGAFSYLQFMFGVVVGYSIIAYLLIPLFYRLNVTSLYEYLDSRYGVSSHRSGAWIFFISKVLSASLRAFVICIVVQQLLCNALGVPLYVTAALFMLLVWLYTHRGGVASVVWTDVLKTICMVGCIVLAILFVLRSLGLSLGEAMTQASERGFTQIFFFDDTNDSRHFLKMFISGIFLIVANTGLDQDIMQRVLSSRTERSAQRNMVLSSLSQVCIIGLMLVLGAMLHLYLVESNLSVEKADDVFAFVATREGVPIALSVLLVLGIVSSTFSTTGSALTSLTTSFTMDILGGGKDRSEEHLTRLRKIVHIGIAVVLTGLIFAFDRWGNDSAINLFYRLASYTYGPLLGMFAFGIFTKRRVRDRWVPIVVILAPLLSFLLDHCSQALFGGYKFGFEILLVNAAITMIGLLILSKRSNKK